MKSLFKTAFAKLDVFYLSFLPLLQKLMSDKFHVIGYKSIVYRRFSNTTSIFVFLALETTLKKFCMWRHSSSDQSHRWLCAPLTSLRNELCSGMRSLCRVWTEAVAEFFREWRALMSWLRGSIICRTDGHSGVKLTMITLAKVTVNSKVLFKAPLAGRTGASVLFKLTRPLRQMLRVMQPELCKLSKHPSL